VRALSLGRPLVVTDIGWFAELPDDVVVKVPLGENEVDTLVDALERADAALGARGRAYAAREHDVERVAEAYAAALEEAAGGTAVRDAVLSEVAHAAGEVGLSDTAELGRRLREVGIGD
jgi:hypothetical protein